MPLGFSRRDFLTGVLVTGTTAAVATYFTPNGSSGGAITLQFLAGDDQTGSRQVLLDMWRAGNPRVEIATPSVAGSTADQRASMIQRIRAKAADVLALDIIDIPYFQQQGLIRPVDLPSVDFLAKPLIPSRLGSSDPNAQCWAVPFNSDVGMLFTRGQADSATPDPTLTVSSVINTRSPIGSQQFAAQLASAPSSATSEAFVVNILEQAVAGNSAVLSETGVPSDELEVWQSALQPIQQAVASQRVYPCADEAATTKAFQAGHLAFMRNWPVQYRVLQQSQDPDAAASTLQVDELPTGILGGQSLAVSSTCQNVGAAQEFINFMTSPGAQKVLASYGLAPAVVDAYNAAPIQAIVPHLSRVRGAIEHAVLRPVHPNYSCYSSTLAETLGSLLVTGRGLTTSFLEQSAKCLR